MLKENEEKFFYNEEKLNFIINHLKLDVKEIAHLFGVKPAYISKLREQSHNSLKPMHLYAFSSAFNIPYKIFDKNVNTTEQIKTILEETKKDKRKKIFKKNEKLLSKLIGVWYAYIYPSNLSSSSKNDGIWIVETTITEDCRVIDEYNNEGFLEIGRNQSLILKESYDEGDLTIIRFSNRQVAYKHFRFVIISTQNGTEHEMINFGFYSRSKYSQEEAKDILGDISKVQLKLDLGFNDRVVQQIVVE